MLLDIFIAALQYASDTATNSYLHMQCDVIKEIEASAPGDQILENYIWSLIEIAESPGFVLDGNLTNYFMQLLGEAYFYLICKNNGIGLDRIKEQKRVKTPDFKYRNSEVPIHFEVKTLSVVGGAVGINKDLNDSLEAHANIAEQLSKGKSTAFGESVAQPLGAKPYEMGNITAAIDTLLEKTRQNIKSGQYNYPNTFLVLNLSCINTTSYENCILRPAYPDDYMFPKAVTGELWMVAFGRPGMLIHGNPEFEGNPCIEATFDKVGILADEEYEDISGLIFIIYPLSSSPETWGLFRNKDYNEWIDTNPGLLTILKDLVDNNFNDDLDANGWRLQGNS
jgi:hypothetical protein